MSVAERLANLTPEQRLLAELLARQKQGDRLPQATARPRGEARGKLGAFDLLHRADRDLLPEGIEDAYPAARLQLAMLYHQEMTAEDDVPAYHNVNSFHVEATFDFEALSRSVARAVARNPMLRTSFDLTRYSEPIQLVHRAAQAEIHFEDLRCLPPEERRPRLEKYWQQERTRLFDLARPPLMRFGVHAFGDDEFHLTLTELHAISEGWGTANILAGISDDYFADLAGQPLAEQPPPPVSYREFIRLEQEALTSAASRSFWEKKLAGAEVVRPPRWPAASLSPRRSVGRKHNRTVPAEITAALDRLGRQMGLPPKSVTLAVHLKVMSLISGRTDLLAGIQTHGRPEELGGDEVHGVFINTVPLRFDASAGTWADLARRAFESETELLPHRRFPLAALQQGRGEEALIEIGFTYLHFHSIRRLDGSENFRLRGGEGVDLSVTHFPLMVAFHLMEGGDPPPLLLIIERDNARLSAAQALSILGLYDRVLAAMARDPMAPHHHGCFLSPGERQQALLEWNDTAVSWPGPRLLHARVAEQARQTPDSLAVCFEHEALTYAELMKRSGRLAQLLLHRAQGPPGVVGVFLERCLEMVMALLGILEAGGAYLPLDPGLPHIHLDDVLRQAKARRVVTVSSLADRLQGAGQDLLVLDRLPEHRTPAGAPAGPPMPRPAVDVEDAAYVIFTSGTTGRPKGVVNVHGAIVNRLLWMQDAVAELGGEDRVLQKTSYGFDVSVWELFLPLLNGACLEMARPGGHQDSQYLVDVIRQRRITTVHFVPSMLRIFLDEPDLEGCFSLRRVVASGEALTYDLRRRFFENFSAELHNLYGPTEAAVDVAWWDCRHDPYPGKLPIGMPIANAELHALGPDLEPVPLGVPGELHIGGRPLARGYVGNARETAQRFVPDPFATHPGGRLYRTGDLVRRLPEGCFEFLGRNDHQIKLRGFRIELGEIETRLETHPKVHRSVVLLRDDGGDPRLVAYVVPAAGEEASTEQLRPFLRNRLPEYMVPTTFVSIDKLPLLTSGKLDRKALPAPSQGRPDLRESLVLPRNATETVLAELWRNVLELDEVGIYDNFFDLGGDSLRLLRLHRMVRQKLETSVPITQLFRHATIAAFAESLENEPADEAPTFEQETRRAEVRKSAASRQRARRRRRAKVRED